RVLGRPRHRCGRAPAPRCRRPSFDPALNQTGHRPQTDLSPTHAAHLPEPPPMISELSGSSISTGLPQSEYSHSIVASSASFSVSPLRIRSSPSTYNLYV